jgi:hypothetical protein
METISKNIELANKYGFPVPLILVLIGLGLWAAFQAKWTEREKYYYELLAALGKWKNSLADRLDYYMEPGSEYRDDAITVLPGFITLSAKGSEAAAVVRDQLPVARLFLDEKTVSMLDEMASEHWLISEMDAVCTQDYLEKTKKLVANTYVAVFTVAKKDLKRSRYLALAKKFLPQ